MKKSAAKFDAADFFIPPAPVKIVEPARPRAALALPPPGTADDHAYYAEGAAMIEQKKRTLLVYLDLLPCWRCSGTVEKGGHDVEYCPLFWHLDYRAMSQLRTASFQRREYLRQGGEL